MQWMVLLTSQKQGGGLSWLNLSINNKVQTKFLLCHGLGQEPRQSDLDFHYIYIYKVFKHTLVQWMNVSMHLYFIEAMNVS